MKFYRYQYVKPALVAVVVFSLLSVLAPYSFALLVTDNVPALLRAIGIVALVHIALALALYWQLRATARAQRHIQRVLAQQVDQHFALQSYTDYQQTDHGEHLSLYVNDIPRVLELTFQKYLSRIQRGTVTLASFLALLNVHYVVALLAVGAALIMGIISRLFRQKLSQYTAGLQQEKATYTGKMRELLQGFATFFEQKAFPLFYQKAHAAHQKYTHYQEETQAFAGGMSGWLTLVNGLLSVIALGYVAYAELVGTVRPGALLAVLGLFPSFGNSAVTFFTEGQFYQSGVALFKEKFSFATDYALHDPDDLATAPAFDPDTAIASLALEGVTVPFGTGLRLPDVAFRAGKKYALVGPSGSGKSTLLKVLLGEISDYRGRVLVNGNEKKPEETLFSVVGYVSQDTFLFTDTVKNNLDLHQTLTDAEAEQLLAAVGLDEFALDTMLQENGRNLSGGQRQRLAFARTLAQNKPILVLDEATANLDAQTAQRIEQLALASSKLVIMITHHLTDALAEQLDEVVTLTKQ